MIQKYHDDELGTVVLYTDYAKLEAEHKEAMELLEKLENSGETTNGNGCCPVCGCIAGHVDCKLLELVTKWQGE